MKRYIKTIDPAALISSIYFSIVWMTYIYLNLTKNVILVLMLTCCLGAASYFVLGIIIEKLRKAEGLKPHELSRKKKITIFLAFLILTFLFRLLWIFAYYPGAFEYDHIVQYAQALCGSYNDWHPVWHTLLFFTIPLKIFGKPAAIIILQNIYLSLVLAYMAVTITEIWNGIAAIIAAAYILLNPFTSFIMLFPYKDVAFALGGLFCSIMGVKLVLKRQETYKLWKLIFLGVMLSWTTLFRHNAILFTAPLLAVLIFHLDRKTWLKIFVPFIVSLIVIKVPIYGALGVEKPDKRVLETTGLPITVIGNVAKETPFRLDEELSELAYSIIPQEKWDEEYKSGNFNSIKWFNPDLDYSAVEAKGYLGMLRLMIKCFKISPCASFNALFALTDVVYGFETGLEGFRWPFIFPNDYGIEYTDMRIPQFTTIVDLYSIFVNGTIFRYFNTLGVALFVMLAVGLSRLKFNDWASWKKAFMLAPIFCYNFGTMLLLTGPDSRFFIITFLTAPLFILFSLCNGGNDNEC